MKSACVMSGSGLWLMTLRASESSAVHTYQLMRWESPDGTAVQAVKVLLTSVCQHSGVVCVRQL
jgi:hypothetical protein